MKRMPLAAGAWRRLQCALVLVLLMSPALADDFSVTSGLSAHWYNSERDGEGLVLEILDEETALLYWFTYDEEGNQRWLLDVGEISGAEIFFPELTVTRGGRFGPDFDPEGVELEVVGEASLSFTDCDQGEFTYTAFGHSETIPMERLSQTMAAGCQLPHGVPGEPIREYAGQSGSWYDPTHNGEGYTMHWLSRDEALLIWFSYDSEGNQVWMTGTGSYEDGRIEFPMLQSTHGGQFGGDFDPEDVEFFDWGSLELELDCQGGSASFDSPLPEFGSGTLELDRLTYLARPACPYERPKLTELFEISYEEIEIIPGPPSDPNRLRSQDLAEDGTVIAFDGRNNQLKIHSPDADDWAILGDGTEVATGTAAFLSNDATRVISTERLRPGEPTAPLQWQLETGWRVLSDLTMRSSVAWGTSRNLEYVVGEGRFDEEPALTPFIWSAEGGQRELPAADGMSELVPQAVSSDGRVVAGYMVIPRHGGAHARRAVRWVDDDEPEVLLDPDGIELAAASACSANCEVVFGMDQYEPEEPGARQPFYLTQSGGFQYLGRMDDAIEGLVDPPYSMWGTSADGTIAVGSYLIELSGSTLGTNGLIWTQATGLVPVRQMLTELEVGDNDWQTFSAIRITASGNKVLLAGDRRHSSETRAVILTLQPRNESEAAIK